LKTVSLNRSTSDLLEACGTSTTTFLVLLIGGTTSAGATTSRSCKFATIDSTSGKKKHKPLAKS
jgi:hypothetical protein